MNKKLRRFKLKHSILKTQRMFFSFIFNRDQKTHTKYK